MDSGNFSNGHNFVVRWLLISPIKSVTLNAMKQKVTMRNGDALLIMVKNGEVIHYTWNLSLPHIEFVKRATGDLPEGAWVGTVTKLDDEIMAITSKYFFNFQLPGPSDVYDAVKKMFE